MRWKFTYWLALVSFAAASTVAHAQGTASIRGYVTSPISRPMANAQVILSSDGVSAVYTFTTDKDGNYAGDGIVPRTYVVLLSNGPHNMLDRVLNVKFAPHAKVTVDFDLSSPEYIMTLPPYEQERIAEIKQQDVDKFQQNAIVPKLNLMLKEARQDEQDEKYADAATIMQQAVEARADSATLWLELASAQAGQKKYDTALINTKKALALNAKQKTLTLNAKQMKTNLEFEGDANEVLGRIYANTDKVADAVAAYDAAAKAEPAKAAMYYANETILLSRTTQVAATVAAADKAIAADPSQPIPYYLKGQALINQATIENKKYHAAPGTVEAYKKYLELAPNGQFAADVKAILGQFGEKVVSKCLTGKEH